MVVPGTHNVYGDGSCAIVSLKYMSVKNPQNGSVNSDGICWGGYNVDNGRLTNYNSTPYVGSSGTVTNEIIGVGDSDVYLPSDKFTAVTNPYDIKTSYYYNTSKKYAPSPYLNDGSRNPIYYQTTSPSTTANCLSDFDGVGNTQKIIELATRQTNWKTASAITNSSDEGHYPAACCCWRYHTEGTFEGDWYLPAAGELGYLMVRFKTINDTIQKLIGTYGQEIGSLVSSMGGFLSSSEFSFDRARDIYFLNGYIRFGSKGNPYYVRAFSKYTDLPH